MTFFPKSNLILPNLRTDFSWTLRSQLTENFWIFLPVNSSESAKRSRGRLGKIQFDFLKTFDFTFYFLKNNLPFEETKNNGDPVKFIPENAYSRTETTVIHVIQPTQVGPDRDFCHQTVLFQNSQEIFCIKCREVHRTKTLRSNHSSFRSDIYKVYSNHLIFYFSWMLCFFMFLFGCWPCCAIPFCIGSLKGTLS